MVFITLVCSYLSSTLLKINAEQIIKLSSQNLRKAFALIAAGEAGRPNLEPLPLSGLPRVVSGEGGVPGRGWQSSLGQRQPDPPWDRGWARVLEGGSSGPLLPHIHADVHRHAQRRTDTHTAACKHASSHAYTPTHRLTPSVLLGAGGAFCLGPEGPCHRPEWAPCPNRA